MSKDQANLQPGAALARMRAEAPLVHNITNYVAMTPSANALLAIGASPAMLSAKEEVAEFARIAQALVVNIGTLQPETVAGMALAVEAAMEAGKPWVFDPVAHFATGYRRETARRLLAMKPTLVRGNASEILALGGEEGAGRGVDAGDPVAIAEGAARALARETGGVIAVSGAVDYVTDGRRAARVRNGHPLMPKVTALGCSLSAVCGAFLGAGLDPFQGATVAFAAFGLAGERAAARARGPGSLMVHLLDELHLLTPDGLDDGARIEFLSSDTADPERTL